MEDWASFLSSGPAEDEEELLRRHGRTGRPLGSKRFIDKLEKPLDRTLRPQKGGRPPKATN